MNVASLGNKIVRAAVNTARLVVKLAAPRRRRPPGMGGTRPPDCGKPAPLRPSPSHHLVAMNGLPPAGGTFLLEAD